MGDYAAKGRQLMDKAEKKLGSWSMFGNKYEDAAELIEKACNQFKLGKACEVLTLAYMTLNFRNLDSSIEYRKSPSDCAG